MSAPLALAELVAGAYRDARRIAHDGAAEVDGHRFAALVDAWHGRFATLAAPYVAVYFGGGDEFLRLAAALLGAWRAGKTVCLTPDGLSASLAALRDALGGAAAVACAGDFPSAAMPLRPGDPATAPAAAAPPPTALLLFTSGSRGTPVAIPKTFAQLDAEIAVLSALWDRPETGDALVHSTVSAQHFYGLLFVLLWPLAAGRPFRAARLGLPAELASRLGERASILVSSPAHLARLPEHPAWAAAAERLVAVYSSGGPLPAAAVPDVVRLTGRAATEVYGSTETGGIAWRERRRADDAPDWTPFPNARIDVDDGLLRVYSPQAGSAEGYLTADRVERTPKGFLLNGRADRIVKLEEQRLSLDAIERALAADPWIDGARLLVVEGARRQLGAVLVPSAEGWAVHDRDGPVALTQGLRERLAATLAPGAIPRLWRCLPALPVTRQGKTPAALLARLFDPRRPPSVLLERGATTARVRLAVDPRLPFFDGHFPGQPIVPGVAQLEWVMRYAQELFDPELAFAGIDGLKFQRTIEPGAAIDLVLDWERDAERLRFELRSAAGVHAAARIRLGACA